PNNLFRADAASQRGLLKRLGSIAVVEIDLLVRLLHVTARACAYRFTHYTSKGELLMIANTVQLTEMIQGSCLCGAVRWQFKGQPDGWTACNCTACRRYGVLWAYDYEDEGIKVSGKTQAYVRGKALEFHFCPVCGCVAFWRGLQKDQQGRLRIAV